MDPKRVLSLIGTLLLASAPIMAEETPAAGAAPGGYVFRLSPSGDVLAAIPSDGSDRGAYLLLAPLEPRPEAADASLVTGVSGILTLPTGDTGRVNIGATQAWIMARPAAGLAPWCNDLRGWQSLSGPAGECLGLSGKSDELQPAIDRLQADLAYSTERFDLALAYGVTNTSSAATWAIPVAPIGDKLSPLGLSYPGTFASAALPELASVGQDVTLSGTWRWTPGSAINVSAAVGQTSLTGVNFLPLAYEHAALGLGLSRGAFSGRVIGRVVRPNVPGGIEQPWAGLDVGISWRTPWHGELSFGARNLITRGTEPRLADPTTTELEQAVTRTPYVQYKQDL